MSGIQGLGDRAVAGQTGPAAAQKAADFNQLGLRVDTENVLGIYAAVAKQVARLRGALQSFQMSYGDGMPLLGNGQPVSPHFSRSFNESTAKLVALCTSDVEDLHRVAEGLREAALAYGKSEDQIKGSFNQNKYVYTPIPTLPDSLRPIVQRPSTPPPARSVDDLFRGGTR
jgi:hypothetical protein